MIKLKNQSAPKSTKWHHTNSMCFGGKVCKENQRILIKLFYNYLTVYKEKLEQRFEWPL